MVKLRRADAAHIAAKVATTVGRAIAGPLGTQILHVHRIAHLPHKCQCTCFYDNATTTGGS